MILAAEDDANEVLLLRHAFRKSRLPYRLVVTQDGEETVSYLAGAKTNADIPRLILLDLIMPVMGGLQVLEWLRSNPRFAAIPVIVLSSALSPTRQVEALRLGAREFVPKPSDPDELVALLWQFKERFLHENGAAHASHGSQPVDLGE